MNNQPKPRQYPLPNLDLIKLRQDLALLRLGKLPWPLKAPKDRRPPPVRRFMVS